MVCREGLAGYFLNSHLITGVRYVCIFLCRFEALAEILWRCRQISKQVRSRRATFVIGKGLLYPFHCDLNCNLTQQPDYDLVVLVVLQFDLLKTRVPQGIITLDQTISFPQMLTKLLVSLIQA